MPTRVVGILGGSGLGDAPLADDEQDRFLVTPHGAPSDPPRVGRRGRLAVVVLARHGRGHRVPPHRLNHRANLWALQELGVTHILATSSTGSLKAAIRPGTFVVPHDFVSFWNIPTFHDETVHHATPSLDEGLRKVLATAAKDAGATARPRGVYVQTTGPRLETRAEIAHFRSLGDVLGMTMASEATLASEIGMPYAALCSVDNYGNGIVARPLTYDAIQRTQRKNAELVRRILDRALEALA
ncbi:MAG: MTAP family purine nucleoside phosphorylase [Methanobacteriota archaeon]